MYRWIEHTGEQELEVEAENAEGVFAESLVAIGELVGSEELGESVDFPIELTGDDRASLLVDWLNELIFLIETEAFVPADVVEIELGQSGLSARVAGRRGAPSHLVKAVTLNRLQFGERDGVWHARVVLDV